MPEGIYLGREALPRDESDGLSESVSHRRYLLGLPRQDAMVEGLSVPRLSSGEGVFETQHPAFRLRQVRSAGVGDGRDDFPQEPNAVTEMVLGDLFDGDFLQRGVHAQPPETSADQILPDGLANGA